MPTAVIEFLIARGAQALASGERLLSLFVPGAFSNLILVGLYRSFKKPGVPGEPAVSAAGGTVSIRQPISPWQVVIGQRRVGGVVTFMSLSSDKKYLHVVVTLACHACEEIGDIWLDNEVVTSGMLDGNGVVTSGRFSQVTQVAHGEEPTLSGTTYTTAATIGSVQAVVEETNVGTLVPYTDVSPATPGPGQFKWSGTTITFDATALDQGGMFRIDYTENIPQPVTRIKKSLGAEAGQPFPDLVAESEGKWTDAHRQTGHSKIYLRFDTSMLQANMPAISAVVKGLKLYDPRTALTTWSANPALAVLAYLTNTEWGRGAALSETGSSEFIAAANTCDESVSLAAGGSELRYRANGSFLTSERPADILQGMLDAMAGTLTQVSSTWRAFAGAYEASTLTLTQSDFAGPIQIEPIPPRDQWANGAKGVFVDPGSNWQPTDFPAIAPTTPYLAEDGGETIWFDYDFSKFVTSSGQSQRLARIGVRKARSGLTVSALFKLTALRAFTGHSVALTFAKYGWSAKEFTIVGSSFAVIDGDGAPALGVQLTLRETFSSIFSWSAEDVAQPTPSSSSLPNPFSVAPPGAPSVSETLYQTTGSAGVKSRATVSWSAVVDPLIKSYEVGWKSVTDAAYQIAPVPNGTMLNIDDLEAGIYLFAVRSLNGIVKSVWSPYTTKELHGLTDPPSDVANFAVQSYSGQAKFTWDKPTANTDLDVLIGGRVFVRWSPKVSSATWNDGVLVNPDGYPGDTSIGFGPLTTGTYMAKAMDSSGNFSVNAAIFVVTEAVLVALTTITTLTESPTFSGTKTNTFVDSGALSLTGTTLIDSMAALIDSWGFIDGLGGIVATGSYAFAAKMDLGSVQPARLVASIDSTAFDVDDLIDSRLDPIDDWGLIDGAVVEDAEVQLMVRSTNDDPNAAPTWGPWHALGQVGDYNNRGFDFRLDFATANTTHNRRVTSLSVAAKH